MPPYKETKETFNMRMVKLYPREFRCDANVLFCKMCDSQINAKQLFQIKQHLETGKHLANIKRKSGSTASQTLITTTVQDVATRDANKFHMDLTRMFLEANIPLHKIADSSVSEFLEKYTKYASPSESKMKTKCLPSIYDEYIQKLKNKAKDKYIWVTLD